MSSQHFPKSVTQARFEQHEDQFERLAAELAKSKQVGQSSVSAVYENIGELRFELEAFEDRERETRLLCEKNKE